MVKDKLIFQGAEAKVYLGDSQIVKDRVEKKYRHPDLDLKLRVRRTKAENKLLGKAGKVIPTPVPEVYESKSTKIVMPEVLGKKLSLVVDSFSVLDVRKIGRLIGKQVRLIHEENIIHGDLTTSNMILAGFGGVLDLRSQKLYFIDYGLGFISTRLEDCAVDIYLLKQAINGRHCGIYDVLFDAIVEEYGKSEKGVRVLGQLEKVEKRRRYRGH